MTASVVEGEATGMESSGLLGAAVRRWYVTLFGVLLTAGLCAAAIVLVPAKYEATARVLLLPPQSSVGKGGNVYLALGGLDSAVAILGRTMSDAQADATLKAQGAMAKFTIEPDQLTSAPVLYLVSDDKTAGASMSSLGVALQMVPSTLDNLQRSAGVPASAYISSSVITQDESASVVRKTQIRALVVAVGAGFALTLVLLVLVDSRLRRRGQRRAQRDAASAQAARPQAEGGSPVAVGGESGRPWREDAPPEVGTIGEGMASSGDDAIADSDRAPALSLPLRSTEFDSR